MKTHTNRPTLLLNVCSVIAMMMVGGEMHAAAQGKPAPAPPAKYENINFPELVAVYRDAYSQAGFRFKDQITQNQKAVGGRTVTHLRFELTNKRFPDKQKAVSSLTILSSGTTYEVCAPCSVFAGSLTGSLLDDYSPEEWQRFHNEVHEATRQAYELIRAKLGKSPMHP